jgi:hypothetical protein
MGKRIIHMCQSVSGALKNWDQSTWKEVAKDNDMTIGQIKERFRIMEFEGKKVIPIHKECEGFSHETGCPGHEVEE